MDAGPEDSSWLEPSRMQMRVGSSFIDFSTRIYYCRASDGEMVVDLLRFGDSSADEEVNYSTEDHTAVAGWNYRSCEGTVRFQPGDFKKQIRIPIVPSEVWRSPLDFRVRLVGGPEQAARACFVWILHQGAFPTSALEESDVGAGAGCKGADEADDVNAQPLRAKLELLVEFYRKLLSIRVVRVGCIKLIGIFLLDTLLFLWQLGLSIVFVDKVLSYSAAEAPLGLDRVTLACVLGVAHMLPVAGLNRLKERIPWLGIRGQAVKSLQADSERAGACKGLPSRTRLRTLTALTTALATALPRPPVCVWAVLRTYLFFTDESRHKLGQAGFINAIFRDGEGSVEGFAHALESLAVCIRIVAVMLCTAFATPYALPLQLLMPIIMFVRLGLREKAGTQLRCDEDP